MKHLHLYEDFHYDSGQYPLFPDQESNATDLAHMFIDTFKSVRQKVYMEREGINKVSDVLAWMQNPVKIWYNIFNEMVQMDDVPDYNDMEDWHTELNDNVLKYLTDKAQSEKYSDTNALKYFEKLLQSSPYLAITNGESRMQVIEYFKTLPAEKMMWYANKFVTIGYYNLLIECLKKETSNGNRYVKVYRAITMPDNSRDLDMMMDSHTGVGVFWSYALSGAIAYSGNQKNEVILEAQVDARNIDIDITLHKALWHLSHEKEIQINDDTTVELLAFSINGKQRFSFDTPLHVHVHQDRYSNGYLTNHSSM